MNVHPQKEATVNPLRRLHGFGQAVWADFLSRDFVADGDLRKLVEVDGLTGVTSNPSIFEKAIASGDDYASALEAAIRAEDSNVMSLYERLAVEDIRNAADVLRPVYERTKREDGYVSLEVSPYLAMDTEATVAEARRLWSAVGRNNLMIKVPATAAGLPAIRRLIGEGINVNITLLFSQQVYEEVIEAYVAGLEDFLASGGNPDKIASVASFFVSRIDVMVDRLIEERLGRTKDARERASLMELRGKVAIANAKLAYQSFLQRFAHARWEKLKVSGARVQRLLWASTGTKNPDYSDVLYVDALIGADTVNTMPLSTMDAFRDHGNVRASLTENVGKAAEIMEALSRCGISIDAVTQKLTEEGVQLFAEAFDKLLGAVARKRAAVLGHKLNSQTRHLSAEEEKTVVLSLESWRRNGDVRRLWAADAALWTGTDEAGWLGWLRVAEEEEKAVRAGLFSRLSDNISRQGFTHAVLLGMGGSSLGPEVLTETFGPQEDHPRLLVLDSTDPAQIRTIESMIDPAHTLFIVSSKSGTTLEPNILMQYFYERAKDAVGATEVGSRFIAVTDPGSKLETIAERERFGHVAFGQPNIGGRYSVLSDFGLVPAAVMGLDVGRLLGAAWRMMRSCDANVPPADNPAVVLGTVLGVLGKIGRDKITILTSPGIADFGAWLEQLLAESTGKHGKGLIPIDAEPLGAPVDYGNDRVFIAIRLSGEEDRGQESALDALERAGQPVVRIVLTDRYDIAQQFFLWELATAVAGSILGINPFDQPDVEASKEKTRKLTQAYEESGALPSEVPVIKEGDLTLFGGDGNVAASGRGSTLVDHLRAHLDQIRDGDYCALLAYIERNKLHRDALQKIRLLIRDRKRVATCLEFGPRFLHSTGQAYKGGPNTGVFLQITCDDSNDIQVPDQQYTFGVVKAAQARADLEVLAQRGRRALRVHLGPHVAAGLAQLEEAISKAFRVN
jgi:transaldolase/glucose-6-phosphate isomerase